jgi:hypothetical protein
MVILMCLTGLKSDWFKPKMEIFAFCVITSKVMTQNANISIFGFLQFCTKTLICVFCVFAFCVVSIVKITI